MRATISKRVMMLAAAAVFGTSLVPVPAQASIFLFTATLTGGAENPPNASLGFGTGIVTWDDVLNTMRVQATFSGLTGNTTASHIHCCTATPTTNTGVATTTPTFAGFPLGVTSGSYDVTLNMSLASSYNAAFVTANGGSTTTAAAALLAGMRNGGAYLNIHSSTFGGGEIRGNLQVVPEPSTVALMAFGLGGLLLTASRRRRA